MPRTTAQGRPWPRASQTRRPIDPSRQTGGPCGEIQTDAPGPAPPLVRSHVPCGHRLMHPPAAASLWTRSTVCWAASARGRWPRCFPWCAARGGGRGRGGPWEGTRGWHPTATTRAGRRRPRPRARRRCVAAPPPCAAGLPLSATLGRGGGGGWARALPGRCCAPSSASATTCRPRPCDPSRRWRASSTSRAPGGT